MNPSYAMGETMGEIVPYIGQWFRAYLEHPGGPFPSPTRYSFLADTVAETFKGHLTILSR